MMFAWWRPGSRNEAGAGMSEEEQARVAAARRQDRLERIARQDWEETKSEIAHHMQGLLEWNIGLTPFVRQREVREAMHVAITVIEELNERVWSLEQQLDSEQDYGGADRD